MIACCWCKSACAMGDTPIRWGQLVFCLHCDAMQAVDWLSGRLVTRPLTIDEMRLQLLDGETMRILREIMGEGRHHA